MEATRFWELVSLVGGVADDVSVLPLRAELQRTGEGEAFEDEVAERVSALRDECGFPHDLRGSDSAEWLGAAVVASGRESYEAILAGRRRLDEDDWDWGEAEALLVAGGADDQDHPDEASRLEAELSLTLSWRSITVPDGVDTGFDPEMDVGDDPAWGFELLEDQEWTRALRALDRDAAFRQRRSRLPVGLHLVVRDSDEVLLMAYPHDEAVEDVVMILPSGDAVAADRRHEFYVEAAVMLVSAVLDAVDGG